MTDQDRNGQPQLRWIETPQGRGVINGVTLVILLAITQHFGLIEPGPPVTLDNIMVYSVYGLAVGVIMYVWTGYRLRRKTRQDGRNDASRGENDK